VLIFCTVPSMYLHFQQSVSVKPNTMLENKGNPILTPFTISNGGHFPIYNVRCACAPKYILSSNYVDIASATGDYDAEISDSSIEVKKIFAGGEYTEYVPLAALGKQGLNPTKADIAIIVSFRVIKFVPWKFRKKFRFITATAKDGSIVWIQQPFK
jgi:hypothetical protein